MSREEESERKTHLAIVSEMEGEERGPWGTDGVVLWIRASSQESPALGPFKLCSAIVTPL